MPPASPAVTLRPLPRLDYHDSRAIVLPRPVTPLEAWNLISAQQGWLLRQAFRIRDAISARFGVKRIGGFTGRQHDTVAPGDHLDFFLVEDISPDRLILTERDRHLDVMICLTVDGPKVTITASVVTHNAFGRAYMLPVGLAHKVIVGSILRRLDRALVDPA